MATLAYDLRGQDLGWVFLFSFSAFIVVDYGNLFLRVGIKDVQEGTITETIEKAEEKTETVKKMEKTKRQAVHKASVISTDERSHVVTIVDKKKTWLGKIFEDTYDFFGNGFTKNVGRTRVSPGETGSMTGSISQG